MEITKNKQRTRRSYFFDIQQEYGNIDSLYETESETSFLPSEAGYLSDQSVNTLNRKTSLSSRRKFTKLELDEMRHIPISSVISDTDDGIIFGKDSYKSKQIPRRNNQKKKKKQKSDIEKKSHRRSWTDSGVSLSRTDQSRCGSIEKEQPMVKPDELYVKPLINDPNNSNNGNIIPTIIIDEVDGNSSEQSSLTNITNISMTETSLCNSYNADIISHNAKNFSEPSLSYETPEANALIKTAGVTEEHPNMTNTPILKKVDSVKSSIDYNTASDSLDDEIIHFNLSKYQLNSNRDPLENKFTSSNKNILSDIKVHFNLVDDTPYSQDKPYPPRRKRKSFLAGIKKVTGNLRPRFLNFNNNKSFKDVSSEFQFCKKSNKELSTEKTFNETDEHIQYLKFDHPIINDLPSTEIVAFKNFEFENAKINGKTESNEILDCLANKPAKSRRRLHRFFRRSRSFSVEKVLQDKRKQNNSHGYEPNYNRLDNSLFTRNSKSLEDIKSISYANQKNSVDDNELNEHSTGNEVLSCSERIFHKQIPRASSLQNIHPTNVNKYCSSNVPSTPMQMHHNRIPTYYNVCNCEDCLYEEYLDYLAFQEFRRNKNLTQFAHQNYMERENTEMLTTTPYMAVQPSHTSYEDKHTDVVLAPLHVVIEPEREAKTFKTSLYDTFV